jgi:nucleoside 2-deoxyribosyltransferase
VSSTLTGDAIAFWWGAGAAKRPGLENLGGRKAHASSNLAPTARMTITICGSMQFHEKMRDVRRTVEAMGHTVYVPKSLELMETEGFVHPTTDEARISAKIEYDFIREHFRKIEKSDAILVVNYDKKDVRYYIGGNTFLEMGYAFGLGKKIYLLYPVPAMDYRTEMHAMQPVVLDGDLGKI